MREKYESLSVTVLRDLAKARGLRHLSGLKKRELVEVMLAEDEKEAKREQETKEEAAVNKTTDAKRSKQQKKSGKKTDTAQWKRKRSRRSRFL